MSDNFLKFVVQIINKQSSKEKNPVWYQQPLSGSYIFEQNTYLENMI